MLLFPGSAPADPVTNGKWKSNNEDSVSDALKNTGDATISGDIDSAAGLIDNTDTSYTTLTLAGSGDIKSNIRNLIFDKGALSLEVEELTFKNLSFNNKGQLFSLHAANGASSLKLNLNDANSSKTAEL